jgi:aspartyl aminopeptidase
MTIDHKVAQKSVKALIDFIDTSPSPWHAVASIEAMLISHDFIRLSEVDKWSLEAGSRYYVVRDDSSIIIFTTGCDPLSETGFRIVGAHTDSPGLRIKPQSAHAAEGYIRLGVEVYGGPILATFSDRDLSLAGRVTVNEGGVLSTRLVHFNSPLLRLPNLAIHMNRKVNEEGLKFNKQSELPLILAALSEQLNAQETFLELLADKLEVSAEAILSWELNVYDCQKGVLFGLDQLFYADSQLDNLSSCHAAVTALLESGESDPSATLVCALFDHEEVGSESNKGADGSFLPDLLERIAFSMNISNEGYKQALANSFMVSCDMAHAWNPNFPAAYEPEHRVMLNQGPVIKLNANQRYTSESISEAMFMRWCEEADVPCQKYSHRTDIPCGSTIGPMTSARLGIRSVDVGNPMWGMHSIRESAGVLDHEMMIRALQQFFKS